MFKALKITEIKVGARHRKDMEDLKLLAHYIRQEGLLTAHWCDGEDGTGIR